jgi:hypothetical protein
MAIKPDVLYPGKITPATAAYPYGKARNVTVSGDGTGTPWEENLVNDIFGFHYALLDAASIVPTGTAEQVGASQYLDALNVIIDDAITVFADNDPVLGVDTLYIDSVHQYIGVGLPAPQHTIHAHVNSVALSLGQFTNTTTGADVGDGLLIGVTATGEGMLWNQENTALQFATNNTEAMRIDASGKVGIGTTNPNALLHISGSGAQGIISNTNTNSAGSLIIQENSTNLSALVAYASTHATLANQAWFKNYNASGPIILAAGGGGTAHVTVASNGSVGIGTANPIRKLQIHHNTSIQTTAQFTNLSTGSSAADGFFVGIGNTGNALVWQQENNVIQFATNDAECMRINASGNVGIGITAPDGRLHVHTATAGTVTANAAADDLVVENSTDGGISILTPNTAVGALYFGDPDDNDSGSIQYNNSNHGMRFYTAGNATPIIVADVNQRVSIGSEGGLASLDVYQSNGSGAVPVLQLTQSDISEDMISFVGESVSAELTNSIVDSGDVSTPTIAGYLKINITDNRVGGIAAGSYFLPFYSLA